MLPLPAPPGVRTHPGHLAQVGQEPVADLVSECGRKSTQIAICGVGAWVSYVMIHTVTPANK
jgi:hypothetical protein